MQTTKQLAIGQPVRIATTLTATDYDKSEQLRRKALLGLPGKITASHNSHGEVYQVETESGSAHFDRCELDVPKETPLRRGSKVQIPETLSDLKGWRKRAQRARLAHTGQKGKIVSGGLRQGIFGVKTEDGITTYYAPSELTRVEKKPRPPVAEPPAPAPEEIPVQAEPPAKVTVITARIDVGPGNHLTLHTSKDWENGLPMENQGPDTWAAEVPGDQSFEFKVLLNGTHWETGDNHHSPRGEAVEIHPQF